MCLNTGKFGQNFTNSKHFGVRDPTSSAASCQDFMTLSQTWDYIVGVKKVSSSVCDICCIALSCLWFAAQAGAGGGIPVNLLKWALIIPTPWFTQQSAEQISLSPYRCRCLIQNRETGSLENWNKSDGLKQIFCASADNKDLKQQSHTFIKHKALLELMSMVDVVFSVVS